MSLPFLMEIQCIHNAAFKQRFPQAGNLALLSVFALQHSIMARPAFKRVWTKIVPKSVERTTYVLLSSLALVLICVYWQPMQGIVWDVSGSGLGLALQVLFWVGWLIVLTSTFMMDHFDLFGLRQVFLNLKQREVNHTGFRKVVFYRMVRHPIMTGFIIAFWSTPAMTTGHLLFKLVNTAYIYIAVKYFSIAVKYFEEKDLVAAIGAPYVTYQEDLGMFFPGIGKNPSTPKSSAAAE
jgi:methanethiol S-methyltransferase